MAVEQHRIAERQKAVLMLDGMGIQPSPAFADKRINHQQQGGAWHVKISEQHIHMLKRKPTGDEQIRASRSLARGPERLERTSGRGADGHHTFC